MDVHVYAGGIHVNVEEVRWGCSLRNQVLIGFHHGLVEVGAAEVSAVDKEELVAKGLFGAFRAAGVSAEGGDGCIGLNVHYVPDNCGAQEVLDTEFEAFGGLYHVDVTAVVGEGEAYVRAGEGDPLEFLNYMP